MTIAIDVARSPDDWRQAGALVADYVRSLGVDLSFQGIAREMRQLDVEYGGIDGAMLLARENGMPVGCVGLRRFDARNGEVKRLYVLPSARGLGAGRALVDAVIRAARARGYEALLLDTLPEMRAAQAVYLAAGFKPVDAYCFNPFPGAIFLSLRLA